MLPEMVSRRKCSKDKITNFYKYYRSMFKMTRDKFREEYSHVAREALRIRNHSQEYVASMKFGTGLFKSRCRRTY